MILKLIFCILFGIAGAALGLIVMDKISKKAKVEFTMPAVVVGSVFSGIIFVLIAYGMAGIKSGYIEVNNKTNIEVNNKTTYTVEVYSGGELVELYENVESVTQKRCTIYFKEPSSGKKIWISNGAYYIVREE